MPVEAWMTIGVILAVITALAVTRVAPDVILIAAVALLLVSGTLDAASALSGFSNTGVLTVAVLYIVAAGLKESGGIQWIAHHLLGQPTSARQAQLRTIVPTASLSAFLNNTAVVAMLIPAIQDWSRKVRIPASKLLIPLSYAVMSREMGDSSASGLR